jgi:hypothetical protein
VISGTTATSDFSSGLPEAKATPIEFKKKRGKKKKERCFFIVIIYLYLLHFIKTTNHLFSVFYSHA